MTKILLPIEQALVITKGLRSRGDLNTTNCLHASSKTSHVSEITNKLSFTKLWLLALELVFGIGVRENIVRWRFCYVINQSAGNDNFCSEHRGSSAWSYPLHCSDFLPTEIARVKLQTRIGCHVSIVVTVTFYDENFMHERTRAKTIASVMQTWYVAPSFSRKWILFNRHHQIAFIFATKSMESIFYINYF